MSVRGVRTVTADPVRQELKKWDRDFIVTRPKASKLVTLALVVLISRSRNNIVHDIVA